MINISDLNRSTNGECRYYIKSDIKSEDEFLNELKKYVKSEDFPLKGIEQHDDPLECERTRQTETYKYRFCALRSNSGSNAGHQCTLAFKAL